MIVGWAETVDVLLGLEDHVGGSTSDLVEHARAEVIVAAQTLATSAAARPRLDSHERQATSIRRGGRGEGAAGCQGLRPRGHVVDA